MANYPLRFIVFDNVEKVSKYPFEYIEGIGGMVYTFKDKKTYQCLSTEIFHHVSSDPEIVVVS